MIALVGVAFGVIIGIASQHTEKIFDLLEGKK